MARTFSEKIAMGSIAPSFDLPVANPECDGLTGKTRTLQDYQEATVLVIVFMCNHCPFVIHVKDELVRIAWDYAARGVQLIGINSNDAVRYPSDSFEEMRVDATNRSYPFPYLYDESQSIAKAYGAVCTPDIFVYDRERLLRYHGQIDETRPGGQQAHGGNLRHALDELLETGDVSVIQLPSIGCNIKWKASEYQG